MTYYFKGVKVEKCKQCVYFNKLVNTKESWGECIWWAFYPEPENPLLPDWSIHITKESGALNPDRKACVNFDGGEK